MRIKIEIPDKTYSDLKKDARREHRSINDLILQSIRSALRRKCASPRRGMRPPIIESNRPGNLYLDNAKIYEPIDFP